MMITSSEFDDWLLYFEKKPPDVQEIQMAVLTTLVTNALGGKEAKVSDYILSGDKPKKTANDISEASEDDINKVLGLM